jgi:hypothetical protein
MQEELTFVKAMSNIEVSPVFLRRPKKVVAPGKKKVLTDSRANATSAFPSSV